MHNIFMNNSIFSYFIIKNVINKIKPHIWKRYAKQEFYLPLKRNTVEVYPWWFKALTFIGIVFVLLLAIWGMVVIPNLLFTIKGLISQNWILNTDISSVRQITAIPSFILGFITGIFFANSIPYFFYTKFIRYDLLHNMTRAKMVIETNKVEAETKAKIQQTMDLQNIQQRDWSLLFRIWLIVVFITSLFYVWVITFVIK